MNTGDTRNTRDTDIWTKGTKQDMGHKGLHSSYRGHKETRGHRGHKGTQGEMRGHKGTQKTQGDTTGHRGHK